MSVLQHFLSRRHNDRSDEYGGSFENRLRLFREILDDVREAIGDSCALAVRLAVDELMRCSLRADREKCGRFSAWNQPSLMGRESSVDRVIAAGNETRLLRQQETDE